MNRFFPVILPALLLLFFTTGALAQQPASTYDPNRYKDEPLWIQMMNDPNANYYETIEAFREFWEGYKLPGEPEEMTARDGFEREIGLESAEEREREKKEKKEKKRRKAPDGGDYSFEVKQFKGWWLDAQDWVQPDGRILPPEERQKLIEQQQKELKEIENKQKQ
ncbi:MAG: hypothetical protein IT259_11420 [Saprospiraceae bacterium]|nr:hypothetical protein [Saprospiraceae bacterium]